MTFNFFQSIDLIELVFEKYVLLIRLQAELSIMLLISEQHFY